jgi:protein involved in polysaccharide export with SLBB domain
MNRVYPLLLLILSLAFAAPGLAQIQSGQVIQIEIKGVPQNEAVQINGQYPVSDDGMIRMPYIGSVRAAGINQNQLASSIEGAYKSAKIYRTPTINVMASSSDKLVEKSVTVGGYVRKTGPVPWTKGLTLYQTVQAAGGENEFGSLRHVRLIRSGKQQEYDLKQIQFKGVLVEPGDTIVVPQKGVFEGN